MDNKKITKSETLSSLVSGGSSPSIPSISAKSSSQDVATLLRVNLKFPSQPEEEDAPFDPTQESAQWHAAVNPSQTDSNDLQMLNKGESVDSESLESESDEEISEDANAEDEPSSTDAWIPWFCSLPGHDYFLEVPDEYIEDDFNLTGLSAIVPYFTDALDMILDYEPESSSFYKTNLAYIESSAELLYGLIHQRYIISRTGLPTMADRYQEKDFGTCPRIGCAGTGIVPCGRGCNPGEETIKMYCPRCNDLYHPKEAKYQNVDGAFFGPTFPHLLFNVYPDLIPSLKIQSESSTLSDIGDYTIYTPKIFGFKISKYSNLRSRMRGLRWRNGVEGS